jgi:hypothetical protein
MRLIIEFHRTMEVTVVILLVVDMELRRRVHPREGLEHKLHHMEVEG